MGQTGIIHSHTWTNLGRLYKTDQNQDIWDETKQVSQKHLSRNITHYAG